MMRCRPGTVTPTAFATVPDQRCTASLSLALHRIRDTSPFEGNFRTLPQPRVTTTLYWANCGWQAIKLSLLILDQDD